MSAEPLAPPDDRRSGAVPTLKDVAALAGVSYQTASRVINDHPNVLPSTRERVQSAIDALQYRPDETARALQARRRRPS